MPIYNYNQYNFLISPCRFDLMAKYLYVKYFERNIETNFFKNLYKNHIITFNNCWEYPGTKTNIQDFLHDFDKLIKDIKINGFNEKYPIPIGINNIITNGAHRLMTSFFFKKNIYYKNENKVGFKGWNNYFFINRTKYPPLETVYIDTMALEYININPNIRILCIYPTAYNLDKIDKIKKIISQYGYLYYEKTVNLNRNGFNNFIKELYRDEKWIGGAFPPGIPNKTKRCYENNPTTCFLIHMNDLSKLIEFKEKCRSFYSLKKDSLHVSDYTYDTFRIAASILNKNSVYFLNNGTNDISSETKKLLNKYFNEIKDNNEDYCLTSSLIMEMHGLRKCKDIDYLHKDDVKLRIKSIGVHDGKWLSYYSLNKDEIIYNPQYHFYFNGLKFTTLDVIKKMKERRGEPKDINDIKLIESKELTNVIFYCSWKCNTKELLSRYNLMTKNNSGIFNNIKGTLNINIADYVIFVEGIPANFDLSLLKNKKVICFPREPFRFKNWKKYNFKHGFTYDNFFHVVTNPQFLNKNYNFLIKLPYTEHHKKFSAIISNKKGGGVYTLRRNILINFAKKYPNLCDMYGFGWDKELGSSYKGKLECYHTSQERCKTLSEKISYRKLILSGKDSNTKFSGLINYKYSLCIENCTKKNYFTEKFTDAILCWTIPIYYGCSNISEYFPDDCYYTVDITSKDCLEKIIKIINRPVTKQNIEALAKARELILNKYNIWGAINNIVNK